MEEEKWRIVRKNKEDGKEENVCIEIREGRNEEAAKSSDCKR